MGYVCTVVATLIFFFFLFFSCSVSTPLLAVGSNDVRDIAGTAVQLFEFSEASKCVVYTMGRVSCM